jgi:MFS family permease
MRRLLARRNFALLWVAGLVSMAGDWVLMAALPYYVFARTGSTLATAGMIGCELLPGFVIGSIAGVFVDRWDRRRVLVRTNLLQAVVVLLLLLVVVGSWLWVVYAVAALQSMLASFAMPAEGALLPTLVERSELVSANALNALNNRIGRLVGAPLGGVLLGSLGLAPVVIVDAATFVGAAVLVGLLTLTRAPLRAPVPPVGTSGSRRRAALRELRHEWLDGMTVVGKDRRVATLFFVLGLMTFGGTMLDPLDVAWVRRVLEQGPAVYGSLMTTHSVLGIAGTLVLGSFGLRLQPRYLIGLGSCLAGVSCLVQYNLTVLAVAFSMSAVRGFTSVLSSVGVETLVQRDVPDSHRGRVMGSLGASGALLSLLGAAAAGSLAEVVGIVVMLNVAGALIVASGVLVLVRYRTERPAEDRATVPSRSAHG